VVPVVQDSQLSQGNPDPLGGRGDLVDLEHQTPGGLEAQGALCFLQNLGNLGDLPIPRLLHPGRAKLDFRGAP